MCRLISKRWSALVLLVFAAGAFATPAEDWAAGQRAFQDGDHASALLFFEKARDAGLDGPAVHYNIAVSQFKLGRYESAGKSFALIARRFPRMRGLAEYNLGLVARRLGNLTEARAHYLRAYELSPDNRTIRVLASRRLRELEPDVRTASRWTVAVGMRAGIDDNVALRDEAGLPVGTTTESPMTDGFVSIQGPWNGRSGLRLDGSAYLVKYFDADEFDQSEVRGGVFYEWRPDDWRIQIGPHASAGSLGGDAFDRKVGGSARIVRYIGRSASVDLRYAYDDVSDADSLFAGIAGSRQQFDARIRWYADGHRLQLRYGLETNDRADPGVSPDRNRFAIDFGYLPEAGWGYDAGVDFRKSDYADLATPRDEELLTLRGSLMYAFPGNWVALFEYRITDNDSTDETYSYDRAQITLGATKSF